VSSGARPTPSTTLLPTTSRSGSQTKSPFSHIWRDLPRRFSFQTFLMSRPSTLLVLLFFPYLEYHLSRHSRPNLVHRPRHQVCTHLSPVTTVLSRIKGSPRRTRRLYSLHNCQRVRSSMLIDAENVTSCTGWDLRPSCKDRQLECYQVARHR
jgi:hypothetical protein